MPEVVEAETVAIWNLDHLLGRWPEMILDQHIRHARCFAFEPGGGENKILVPGINRVSRQFFSKLMTSGCSTTGFFDAADFFAAVTVNGFVLLIPPELIRLHCRIVCTGARVELGVKVKDPSLLPILERHVDRGKGNGILSVYSGTPFWISALATSLNAPGSPQLADQVNGCKDLRCTWSCLPVF